MFPLLLTLLAASPPTTAPADSFRYRMVTKSVQEIDMAALGGGMQTAEITTTALVTVVLTDSAGGQVAHITVDSAGMDGAEAMAALGPEMTTIPAGVFFHFFVKDGRIASDATPSVMSLPVMNLIGPISMLFVNPRPMAKIGDLWTDTTAVDTTMAEGASKATTITKWKYSAAEKGGRVLDGEMTGTVTVDSPMGQMHGTSSGTQQIVTRARGPILRVKNTTISDMVMAMGTASMNIKGTATITVEPIP